MQLTMMLELAAPGRPETERVNPTITEVANEQVAGELSEPVGGHGNAPR
jgi:hypothetical protein